MNGFSLAVDVAYSDDKPMDWKVMKEAGVDLAIIKAGQRNWKDVLLDRHATGAIGAGLQIAFYWYLAPDYPWEKQMRLYEEVTKRYRAKFMAVDIEEKYKYVFAKKKWIRRLLSSTDIHLSAWNSVSYLAARHDCEIVPYTRTSYIKEYAPQLATWIYKYPVWLAAYPKIKNNDGNYGDWIVTCDEKEAAEKKFTYCPTWSEYLSAYAPMPHTLISLPRGVKEWKIWQFSGDRVKLPGTGSYIDINWVRGDWIV